VHSNGFSLVRKVLEVAGTSLHDPAPWGGDNAQPAGLELLTPTVIYVKQVMELHEKVRLTHFIDICISNFAGCTHALEPNFGMSQLRMVV
jgi:phosphoribosylformylglycinamidine cyclo-ligase